MTTSETGVSPIEPHLTSEAILLEVLNPETQPRLKPEISEDREWLEQRKYNPRLSRFIEQAQTPEDMLAITEAYVYIRANCLHRDGKKLDASVNSYSYFMNQMLERAATVSSEPLEGTANPEDVADMLEPSIVFFISHPDMIPLYERAGHGSGINAFMAGQLSSQGGTTAEGVAAIRLRERMSSRGFENFKHTKAVKTHDHHIGDRYLTRTNLKRITGQIHGETHQSLPEGQRSLEVSSKLIVDTVKQLAETGDYPIAEQILGAIDKLKQQSSSVILKTIPYSSLVHLGNLLGKQLNQRGDLPGNQRFEDLDVKDLSNMPAAFQRILFAIDPELLSTALSGNIDDNNELLRAKMAYLEALAVQWQEHQHRYSMTVGDVVLRLSAYGMPEDRIVDTIAAMRRRQASKEGVGAPGHFAVGSLRRVIEDWRTNPTHVVSRKRKPGYGKIS